MGPQLHGLALWAQAHLVINSQGQITTANVHDHRPLAALAAGFQRKMFGNKDYISNRDDAAALAARAPLDHWHRGDMKNNLMPLMDKLLLRKRFSIEILLHELKSHMRLEHTCHRSPSNALVHTFSCLAAYNLAQSKVNMWACRIWLGLIHKGTAKN